MGRNPMTTSAAAKPAGAASARQPGSGSGPLRLDRLIRARAIHSMTGEVYRAVGLRGAEIAVTSPEPDGLDDLAGTGTLTTDAGDLTLLPAFADSHEHLMEASRNTMLVPVGRARSIAEFTAMVAAAARDAAPGTWIMTAMAWHESNLAENRLPTGAELDAAAPANPVLARRGGHLAVANTAALTAAGIGPGTPDPPGGKIGRRPDGRPDGVLEGGAVWQVAALAPAVTRAQLAMALGRGSAAYAALGVGTIREAMINTDELLAYQDAADQGTLSVRVRPLIRVGNELTADQATALIDGLGARSGFGDDWLRIWGLKFVMDGGVEGGALERPYANDPANSGHLNWDPAVMTTVCADAVRRGWRIGTHAAGDRAVRTVLDVYEAVAAEVEGPGPLPPWTLVIEHALLSDPVQRERAVRGGFGVTVQHSLLWNMGSEMLQAWGPERTRQVNPLDEWLASGASLAAGTDIARPFNPMLNVWGMATRGTKAAGIQGPEHAIPVATALELYTMGTARLNHDQDRLGSITPGKLADLVAYPADPLTADLDDLPGLTPAFTLVGGRVVHDPDGRLGSPR
jgi:predicted amidohydrolase YtcJ